MGNNAIQSLPLSLYYYPTQVLLLDDDETILKYLGKQIDPDFPFLAYTDPKKALAVLKKNVLPLEMLSKAIVSDINTDNTKSAEALLQGDVVAINLKPLQTDLTTPARFNKFVTAVIDKAMPEMDGLDFCRAVRQMGLPVKLILLTGVADANEAVTAFNDGIIDAFIQKATPDMVEQINHQIRIQASKAFYEASTQRLGLLQHRFPLIQQAGFTEFFQKICREHNVIEYFMLDNSCSYLLITKTGNAKILLMRFAEEFKNAYDIYDESDQSVLIALSQREAFPFTGTECYFLSDKTQWKNNMVPMEKIDNLDVYYAVVDYPENIFSFDRYVSEVWKPAVQVSNC